MRNYQNPEQEYHLIPGSLSATVSNFISQLANDMEIYTVGEGFTEDLGSWCTLRTALNINTDARGSDVLGASSREVTVDVFDSCETSDHQYHMKEQNPNWTIANSVVRVKLAEASFTFTYPDVPDCTVRYDNNGGTGTVAETTVSKDTHFNLKDTSWCSKTGYRNDGWYAVVRDYDTVDSNNISEHHREVFTKADGWQWYNSRF